MRRVGIVALVLVGAVGIAAIGAVAVHRLSDVWGDATSPATEADDRLPSHPSDVPEDAEPAIVDRVVDGDTIRVVAEPGGSIPGGGSVRVRLLNIDAPELADDGAGAECGAEEAAARLEGLAAPGDLVWLAADREDRDVHGRPLRAVWTEDGVFVNELLALDGYAEVLLIAPNDRFHPVIAAAVEDARTAGRGIWGERCPS